MTKLRGRRTLWFAVGAVGAIVLLGIGFAAATAYVRRSLPERDRSVTIPALRAPVTITWDAYAVPSIFAEDPRDLYFALGWAHAQDRLWQMDLARRVAQGRLAEAFGAELVESDRFLRTIGLWRAAARADSALRGDVRGWAEAYAEGVNAWLDAGHPLPPEFTVLRVEPEPWTVRHTLAIGKIMTWDLTEWDLSLELARAVDRLGSERARELLPRVPEWSPRILDTDTVAAGTATRSEPAIPVASAPAGMWPRVPERLRPWLDVHAIVRASNAWVIGPSRSRSGKPILANDMHLPLRTPSTWYLAGLHAPGLDVVGLTLPGVPGVIAGHSDRIAWGFTAAYVDNIDFFLEELDPADSTRYRTPEGWDRMSLREETIAVRGGAPVAFTVAETRHGPVLPAAATTGLPDRVVVMQWTGAVPTAEAAALWTLNWARDAGGVVRALRAFGNPALNVVFADVEGNIGYRLAGYVPVRAGGDGVLPAPGASGEYDWVGTVPFDELPHALNPPSGYIVTANNVPRDRGPFLSAHFMPGFRAARIVELVRAAPVHDAASVHGIQLDVYSLFAERHFRRAVRAARDAGEDEAAVRLVGWDRRARTESPAAALFYTWVERVRWEIASDDYGDSLGYFPWEVLDRVLESGDSRFIDDARTPERETLEAVSARAMREAVRLVGERAWGEIHAVTSEHALGSARWLDLWLGLNVGPVAAAGDPFTVNVAHHAGLGPPFRVTWSVSQRHVVDLGDPDGAGGFILPTGQSGHPLSPHYADQQETWLHGGLWRIPVDPEAARALGRARTVLTPDAAAP